MKKDKMFAGLKNLFEKIKSDKKAIVIIAIGALVMFSVLIIDFPDKSNEKIETAYTEDYEHELEDKLCKLISNIDKAGKVKVMLTFESTKESVYAYDRDESIENKSGENSGKKIKNEYIIVKRDGDEGGLQIKDVYPKVKGAAIVCEGADDPIIKGQIISVVSALFDIKSTNISVAKMAD